MLCGSTFLTSHFTASAGVCVLLVVVLPQLSQVCSHSRMQCPCGSLVLLLSLCRGGGLGGGRQRERERACCLGGTLTCLSQMERWLESEQQLLPHATPGSRRPQPTPLRISFQTSCVSLRRHVCPCDDHRFLLCAVTWPPSLRDVAAGFLEFLSERHGNLAGFAPDQAGLPENADYPLRSTPAAGLVPYITAMVSA